MRGKIFNLSPAYRIYSPPSPPAVPIPSPHTTIMIIPRLFLALVLVAAAVHSVNATPLAEGASGPFDLIQSLDNTGWGPIPRHGENASSAAPGKFVCITNANSPKTDDVAKLIFNSQLYDFSKMCIQTKPGGSTSSCTLLASGPPNIWIFLCGKKHLKPCAQNAHVFG
jgi:hypothetical protein